MAATKRERDYARKRQAKWEQQQALARTKRQRRWTIVAIVAVVALVGGSLLIGLTGQEPTAQETDADAAGTTCPTSEPAPRDGGSLPSPELAENRTWEVTLDLCAGGTVSDVALELDGQAAPQAVASFLQLAQEGYFDGTQCHRLTTQGIYVLQCGDPTASGQGGPGYEFGPIENAPADDFYPAGTLAMARRQGDAESMGSQFFIVYQDSTIPSDAAGGYTVFGTITSGLDAVQAVADAGVADGASDGSPVSPVTIEGVETP